ncbi:MAG: fumarate/nitrate reduction transcriptional regulator Fnr, partial [Gammaproteobacteria bacterium]|nr:fumarate/nitrate reduction transcriptional regulator Fnr [Gammaproteobacteria bacterium]
MPGQNYSKVVNISRLKAAFENGGLHELCLHIGLDEADIGKFEKIIRIKPPLKRGEYLFRQGDSFHSLYAICSGAVKVYSISNDGSEQISGFLFSGDLTGMDAISTEQHHSCAMALETTSYCEIPFVQLEELAGKLPSLQHQLLKLMSKEIVSEEDLLMQLGKKTADERLASMLLCFSSQFLERGFSATEFNLSMSRSDIGNYLGLAVETVSRIFTRFHEKGLINVEGKFIKINDIQALED